MLKTVEYIFKHKNEFKLCLGCGLINYHKNKHCFNCAHTRFDKRRTKNHIEFLEMIYSVEDGKEMQV